VSGYDDRFGGAPTPQGPAQSGSTGSAGPMSQPYGSPMAQPYPSAGGQPVFGAAPVFGMPAQPGQTYGTPAYQPSRSKTWGAPQIISAVVVGIVALAALSFGWNYWQTHRALGVPTSLGGIPQLTGTAADQVIAMATASLKDEAKGKKMAVALYAAPGTKNVVVLAGVRGRLKSVDADLASGGTGAHIQVGHNTCASFKGGVVCERTGSHLTEAVVTQSTTLSVPQVSAMLDEAWAKA
jgi:hypothetical protein